jgi:RNA polymerase sigma factor (TIGR02999 family)
MSKDRESANSSSRDMQSRVYEELRALAAAQMLSERANHTLQPTALVHEAWLRLEGSAAGGAEDRALFFHAAAESMRRILIEHARTKKAVKRGGDRERMPMNLGDLVVDEDPTRILAVDEAIQRISEDDAQTGDVIRLRFFAGLTVPETAEALGISERSVHREWAFARGRLALLLEAEEPGAD